MPFGALPDDVGQLLAAPPLMEKQLLELSVGWSGLPPSQARMAEALRLFVITWDPLEWDVRRPVAFATVNATPPELELVVYVPVWSLATLATETERTIAGVLGTISGSAVVVAADNEAAVAAGQYPKLAIETAVPDLLSDVAAGAALGATDVRLESPGWDDLGLGAITDVVQHAYGPVDLDRSPVELTLTAPAVPVGHCRACQGARFDFPADLGEAKEEMCQLHGGEADKVITNRLARANASNPEGWGALTDASQRSQQPHLPNGLAGQLSGAGGSLYVAASPEELAMRARAVIASAEFFPGRPKGLAMALGVEEEMADQFPDWLVTFVLDLGQAGLGAEAAMVGAALGRVDPDSRAFYDGDVPVALAKAGCAEEAQAQIEANLARWPDDFWIRVHAGDALAELDDLDGAEVHFRAAVHMAEDTDDLERRSDAFERLHHIERRRNRSEPGPRRQPRSQRRKPTRSQRKRK
ncbi:MAG: hypothetical protein ACRDP4_09680 [Nocardioidaceae bacterium]